MFSRIFIERPRFAMVISIVLTLAGIISVFSLPIALYPEITPPEVVVSASYPGASAEVIAKTVGIPLEEEINGVEDMLYMSSSSENSSYQLTVTFKVGVDRDMAQVKVQNRIQQAQSKLPTDVTRQGLTVKSRSSNMLGMISIISPQQHLLAARTCRLCSEQRQRQPEPRFRRRRSQRLFFPPEHARLARRR